MDKKTIMKLACICAAVGMISLAAASCGNTSKESSSAETTETKEVVTMTTAATTAQTSATTETTTTTTTAAEAVTEISSAAEPEQPEPEILHLDYLYSAANRLEFTVRSIDGATDLIDTGGGYLLGVEKVKYYFGIADIRTFLDSAIDKNDFEKTARGDITYKPREGSNVLNCMGEEFTLTSYYLDYNGRGSSQYVGSDGKTYHIDNDISFELDQFTGSAYYSLKGEDGQQASKEESFGENAYIEITYDQAKALRDGSEVYYIQYAADGSIMKIEAGE